MKVLPLLVLLFSSVAFAESKDLEKEEPPRIFKSSKPVNCTTDSYDVIKNNFVKSHGEVGFMRFLSDEGTGIEIIGNPTTGTVTILEFIPSKQYTCFISTGKGLEVNSLIFEQVKKGIETKWKSSGIYY